ncbi:MAG: NAD-dependent epimerase [Synechococcales bacterium]|nr:NAD-dependent epimerase [Synechococcales bacterium]
MKILVTGAAGFIGYHLSRRLLADGHRVFGIDNLNDYYDVYLKQSRLLQIANHPEFFFQKLDIGDRPALSHLFQSQFFDSVVHLAAQAGVRYSIKNPDAYVDSNLVGFANVLEGCRHHAIPHLVFASSSSVYGANAAVPFSLSDRADQPVSFYAATKRANELMAYCYSHLYHLPITGLRFFTVYGPWGRPDMAYFKFVDAIHHGKPIDIYNFGDMKRDFTYIDDVVEGIVRILHHPPQAADDPANPSVQYKIYNLGHHHPVELGRFIQLIEQAMGQTAQKNFLPMQPGDVPITYADISALEQAIDFKPKVPLEVGIQQFVDWYRDYF